MHEFSISRAIADVVLDSAREQQAKEVLRVKIEIGRLSFLNPEQVEFWVQVNFEGTIASRAKLDIRVIEPVVHCQACGYRGGLTVEDDPIHHRLPIFSFSCPRCKLGQIKVEEGRECTVKHIQILRE